MNRFFVNVGPVVRITFAEQAGPDTQPIFRAAVALGHSDAIVLADLLKQLLADIEKQLTEMQQKAEAKANASEK